MNKPLQHQPQDKGIFQRAVAYMYNLLAYQDLIVTNKEKSTIFTTGITFIMTMTTKCLITISLPQLSSYICVGLYKNQVLTVNIIEGMHTILFLSHVKFLIKICLQAIFLTYATQIC